MHYTRRLAKVIECFVVVAQVDVHDSSVEVEVFPVEYVLFVVVGVVFVSLRLLVIFANVSALSGSGPCFELPIEP